MAAGCFVWIPIAIWVIALVQWAVQGDIDVLSAFGGILLGIGLGMTALLAREPFMAPLILVAVIGTMIVFPFMRSALNKKALDRIDYEAVERAYELLRERPDNAAAKFKLAKTIYNKGMPGHALKLAEDALQQMPASAFMEEHRIVKSWRRYKMTSNQLAPLNCFHCGHANQAGLVHCERCGQPFLLDHARGAWVGPTMVRKFIAAWVGMIVALVGIPFAASALPPAISIVVIAGLIALAVVMAFAAFKPKGAAA